MLEIKHLTKIYKTKGGADIKALDDISLSFEECGLVFLLGKSGSGKSTLLNLAGGLDEPTSGEIIVMGKSSKDFSGSDFDSYRNTFVGFVFQEYNVLYEFNVYDNVALALELQGRTKERDKIEKILEEVELKEFMKRKPNTLSGGQKQRIAIARALVKDPQIIMADEPTGALDSATGKQVFETLKRLSKTRLVLVVSHDREFAEAYADRIIELKDGKIISDVTKHRTFSETLSQNIVKIDENTLSVKAPLCDEDLKELTSFLECSNGEIILTRGTREIESFKRVNRIDNLGGRERFEQTTEKKPKEYDAAKTKFIRSRLPAGKAIKIGASGLKLKPIRLIFTILLSMVSFIMFGLFSTMMFYNGDKVLARSFLDSEMEYITLEKKYRSTITVTFDKKDTYTRESYQTTLFTPDDVERFSLKGKKAIGAYELSATLRNIGEPESAASYYSGRPTKTAFAPEDSSLREGLTGSYPSSDDQILVSRYLFECFSNLGYYPLNEDETLSTELIKPKREEDIIGVKLLIDSVPLTVTGVFDDGEIPRKYEKIKSFGELNAENLEDLLENLDDYMLYVTFGQYIQEGVHSMLLTSENFAAAHPELLSQQNAFLSDSFSSLEETFYLFDDKSHQNLDEYYSAAVYKNDTNVFFLDENKTSLEENEVILPLNTIYSLASMYLDSEDAEAVYEAQNVIQQGYAGEKKDAAIDLIRSIFSKPLDFSWGYCDWSKFDGYSREMEFIKKGECKIAGFFISKQNAFYCTESIYNQLEIFRTERRETKYVPSQEAVYSVLLVPFVPSESGFFSVYDRTETVDENDVLYSIDNILAYTVRSTNEIVDMLSIVFLVVGIVLALFASLLLFNFISVSISNKKKEIGILRAVGARGTDVFKIFFSESGIIVGICTVLALIGTSIITAILNHILRGEIGLDVTLFVFGPLPIVFMIAVAAVVALLATFLPVYFAARKKPVESIRAL